LPAGVICVFVGLGLALLLPALTAAERTSVQEVRCEPGRELLLARNGTLVAYRLTATTDLLVGPAAGNGKVACSAGGHVEFHRNGYPSAMRPRRAGPPPISPAAAARRSGRARPGWRSTRTAISNTVPELRPDRLSSAAARIAR
jgi:hypothetical protein